MCVGQDVVLCNDKGQAGSTIKTCADSDTCTNGDCSSACSAAVATKSYLGCDYWPVSLANEVNNAFNFAVAVANPGGAVDQTSGSATVTVSRGGTVVKTVTVQPGTVEVIKLPWVFELSMNNQASSLSPTYPSALVANGAYHLTSTLPVSVYQFSPLEYQTNATATCQDDPSIPDYDPQYCHSYTNDASLLLPTGVLGMDYYAISRQTFSIGNGLQSSATPGFITMVGTQDNTMVTVKYTANVEPGTGVVAQAPGSTATYTLNRGTVLQVMSKNATSPCAKTSTESGYTYCDMGPQYDLTGSHITSDKPIALFGGHVCSFVPYNRWACDHLEEQIFPTETWGQNIIVAQTKPLTAAPKDEPNVYRILSGTDGNSLTFDPNVAQAKTLNAGEYMEFEAKGGFKVSGSGRVAVAQYMVGQNYNPSDVPTTDWGDPSLGLGIPVEQYRTNYDFLSPESYVKSYVNIIAATGTAITLDGNPVQGSFTAIGSTGYGYLWLEIQPGAHHMSSGAKFGITVAGFAPYTSYFYPGGLDLNAIPIG